MKFYQLVDKQVKDDILSLNKFRNEVYFSQWWLIRRRLGKSYPNIQDYKPHSDGR